MALNLRSHDTNLHAAMNALLLWDHHIPKRLVQLLNRTGWCSSYPYMCRSIKSVSSNTVVLAQGVAADESKVKQLAYDNFNWETHTWEPSATHGNITHNEVSALLFVLNIPRGPNPPTVQEVTDIRKYRKAAGARHRMPPAKSLASIMPRKGDQQLFQYNSIRHVHRILSEEIHSFSPFLRKVPPFFDPKALPAEKTEEYYLPTFDQEQGPTCGNMIILNHYWLVVLLITKSVFDRVMFFLLGD
jgi:hypothetical protein